MSANSAVSENLTLAEAAKVFGYTPDHLAYLARGGFIGARRSGRIWLTTKETIRSYQDAMRSAGKPVALAEQSAWIEREASPNAEVNTTSTEVSEESQDLLEGIALLLQRYKVIFLTKHHYSYLSENNASKLGLYVGKAPLGLPVARMPYYMSAKPWYSQELVLTPVLVGLLAVFFILPSLPFKTSLISAFQTAGNGFAYSVESLNSMVEDGLATRMKKPEIINESYVSLEINPEVAGTISEESEFEILVRNYGMLPIEGKNFATILESEELIFSENEEVGQLFTTEQVILSVDDLASLLSENMLILRAGESGEVILEYERLDQIRSP